MSGRVVARAAARAGNFQRSLGVPRIGLRISSQRDRERYREGNREKEKERRGASAHDDSSHRAHRTHRHPSFLLLLSPFLRVEAPRISIRDNSKAIGRREENDRERERSARKKTGGIAKTATAGRAPLPRIDAVNGEGAWTVRAIFPPTNR